MVSERKKIVLAHACVCAQFCVGGSNNCFLPQGGKGGGAGWGLFGRMFVLLRFWLNFAWAPLPFRSLYQWGPY